MWEVEGKGKWSEGWEFYRALLRVVINFEESALSQFGKYGSDVQAFENSPPNRPRISEKCRTKIGCKRRRDDVVLLETFRGALISEH
jgi:hypothetical protein